MFEPASTCARKVLELDDAPRWAKDRVRFEACRQDLVGPNVAPRDVRSSTWCATKPLLGLLCCRLHELGRVDLDEEFAIGQRRVVTLSDLLAHRVALRDPGLAVARLTTADERSALAIEAALTGCPTTGTYTEFTAWQLIVDRLRQTGIDVYEEYSTMCQSEPDWDLSSSTITTDADAVLASRSSVVPTYIPIQKDGIVDVFVLACDYNPNWSTIEPLVFGGMTSCFDLVEMGRLFGAILENDGAGVVGGVEWSKRVKGAFRSAEAVSFELGCCIRRRTSAGSGLELGHLGWNSMSSWFIDLGSRTVEAYRINAAAAPAPEALRLRNVALNSIKRDRLSKSTR